MEEHQPRHKLLGSRVQLPAGAFFFCPLLPKLHFQFLLAKQLTHFVFLLCRQTLLFIGSNLIIHLTRFEAYSRDKQRISLTVTVIAEMFQWKKIFSSICKPIGVLVNPLRFHRRWMSNGSNLGRLPLLQHPQLLPWEQQNADTCC